VEKIRRRRHRETLQNYKADLNFTFDKRESEVNLHNATSLPKSPSNVSPGSSSHRQKPDESGFEKVIYTDLLLPDYKN
jgi:hypothetical protein